MLFAIYKDLAYSWVREIFPFFIISSLLICLLSPCYCKLSHQVHQQQQSVLSSLVTLAHQQHLTHLAEVPSPSGSPDPTFS